MTPDQISLVQRSWIQLLPIADEAASLFYRRLFELDPSLRELFPEDLTEQRTKLMQAIPTGVPSLDRLERVAPAISALGRRHAGYGVLDHHYDTVGEAL